MRELHELRRLHEDHPQYIEAWATDRQSITREAVETLRRSLQPGAGGEALGASEVMRAIETAHTTAPVTGSDAPTSAERESRAGPRGISTRTDAEARVLMAEFEGEQVLLVTDAAPAEEGQVFVRKAGIARRIAVDATRLRLLGFVSRLSE
jgi:ParB family chromosome partitioning protein